MAGNTSADSEVLLHTHDARGVHTLKLNRPRAFNTLDESLLPALQRALDEIAVEPQARAVVIAASGAAFCAGHDLKQMRAHPQKEYYQRLFAQCSRMMLAIQALPVPVIARVQGLATAAGCQLVAQCDLAVAADGATFGVNGIDVGLFCSTPAVPLSRSLPPKQAMEMLLTGQFITAEEACRRGLVNRAVPSEKLDEEVERLLAALLDRPKDAIAIGKALFYRQRETSLEAAYQLAGQTMACNMMLPNAQEGVQAFIDKRQADWPGHPA